MLFSSPTLYLIKKRMSMLFQNDNRIVEFISSFGIFIGLHGAFLSKPNYTKISVRAAISADQNA